MEKTCVRCGQAYGRKRVTQAEFAASRFCSRGCATSYRLLNAPPATPEQVADRFWSKADRSGGPDACWTWLAATDGAGYGCVGHGRPLRVMGAHRVALMLSGVSIPDGMFVCHRCDNPPCVNPSHLFIGTRQDNSDDMVSKGRGRGNSSPGTANPCAKLRDEDVVQIRAMRRSGMLLREIGAKFGVSNQTVLDASRGTLWKHIPLSE